jgi:hypothetical protein
VVRFDEFEEGLEKRAKVGSEFWVGGDQGFGEMNGKGGSIKS